MKKLINDSLYIGQGFLASQLLWVIPLVHGFAKKKKIKTIVFEKKLPNKVKNNYIISTILRKYKIIYYNNLSYYLKYRYLFLIIPGAYLIFKSFFKALSIYRKKILYNKNNWFQFQINHSIWDTSILNSKDGDFNPSFFNKFKAAFICYKKVFEANILLKFGIKNYFLGHSVYGARAFMATLRVQCSNIFCHSGFTIYKQPILRDSSWCFLNKKQLNLIQNLVNIKDVKSYWKKRNSGQGSYEDSRIAANLKNKISKKYQNVIFLHIFRDSPYADIDKKRIFEDYIVWIQQTLTIIKKSNENWTIRLHPNYKRWGENQFLTINKIIKEIFGENLPANISIEDNLNSNIAIFKTAKRIVTFNGTSHLEAAANQIAPIIISETMLSFLYKKLCHKPKSLQEYEKLLLSSSTSKKFFLSKHNSIKARKLIFIREKILKFEKEIGGFHIYAKDSKKKFSLDFSNTEKKLKKNYSFLLKNGEKLTNDIKISMSPKYINLIK